MGSLPIDKSKKNRDDETEIQGDVLASVLPGTDSSKPERSLESHTGAPMAIRRHKLAEEKITAGKNSPKPFVIQGEDNKTAISSMHDPKWNREKDYLDIPALVRSIQRAEGEPDCFRRPKGSCDRLDCQWRRYCLEGATLSGGGEEKP